MRPKGSDEDEFEMRSGASNNPDGSSGVGSCRAPSFVGRGVSLREKIGVSVVSCE